MVAGILYHLGVFMGDTFVGPDRSNRYGHFEDAEASAINRWVIASAGGSWYSPVDTWYVDANARIAPFVERRDAEHAIWGQKDPRLALTLRHWLMFLSNPVFVRTYRTPAHIDRSLMLRNGFTAWEAKRIRLAYDGALDDVLAGQRCFTVDYGLALKEPHSMVELLAAYIGVEPTRAAREHIRVERVHA